MSLVKYMMLGAGVSEVTNVKLYCSEYSENVNKRSRRISACLVLNSAPQMIYIRTLALPHKLEIA